MELTRETLEVYADHPHYVTARMAQELLKVLDNPCIWDGAPEWATEASVHWRNESGSLLAAKVYTHTPPKSRIDEIAEEAVDKYQRGAVGAGSLTDIIKSAILKDREERESSR